MDTRLVRAPAIGLTLCLLALAPVTARAQAALEPTRIMIGESASPDATGSMTLQAVPTDGKGRPISKG